MSNLTDEQLAQQGLGLVLVWLAAITAGYVAVTELVKPRFYACQPIVTTA